MPDLDLLDLLSADHQNLLSVERGLLVSTVTQHLTVERELLYPAIETYGDDGAAVVRSARDADRLLEERLARFETDPSPQHLGDAEAAIRAHVDLREALVSQLRQHIPAESLRALAGEVSLTIGGSPTHPHPDLPDHGVIGDVAEQFAVVADRLRDRFHHHDGD